MSYGDDWTKRGTKLEFAKIIVAPEIFTVKEQFNLPNGKTVMDEAKYFSWTTACDIITHKKAPHGWRMMTLAEAEAIQEYYNNSRSGLLALRFHGFIAPNDMLEYNYSPKRCEYLALCKGQVGCYWINEQEKPLYPYLIENTGMRLRTGSFYVSYGLPLLLVKDL